MEIEEILIKIFEILKVSDNPTFMKRINNFKDILNLSKEDFTSILQNIMSPVPKNEDQEIEEEKIESEVVPKNDLDKESPISNEPRVIPPPVSPILPRPPKTGGSGRKRIPPTIRPTVLPQPLPPGRTDDIKIDRYKTIETVQRNIKKFSEKLDNSLIEAEKELKDHYSVSGSIAGIPCQMCRYYCSTCKMGNEVMEGFDCTATCNMQYYNLRGYHSCSKYSLWSMSDFEEKEFKTIPGNFFRGYLLILCHNHHKAFKQKSYELTKQIRTQLYENIISENYEEEIGSSVNIRFTNLVEQNNKEVPIGIYLSKEHLKYFKQTYEIMEKE